MLKHKDESYNFRNPAMNTWVAKVLYNTGNNYNYNNNRETENETHTEHSVENRHKTHQYYTVYI